MGKINVVLKDDVEDALRDKIRKRGDLSKIIEGALRKVLLYEKKRNITLNRFDIAMLKCIKRHPEEWVIISSKIEEAKKNSDGQFNEKGCKLFDEAMDLFEKKVVDAEYRKWREQYCQSGEHLFDPPEWAIQAVYYILKGER